MMDNIVNKLILKEKKRQKETLMLIPSENYASKEVRSAVGSVLMNKYSEGYPGRRYYQGNEIVDEIENLAVKKAKKLFGVKHANVQPYSGSPANAAIYFALLEPGDKIMGLKLSSGGHLTHGHAKITFSGKYFNSVQFGVGKNGIINYEEVKKMALREKPKLLMIGTTAYPLILDWEKFADIASKINAFLVADISHVAGLVIAGAYPSPVDYSDIIMTTTHKTLRGPRGAIIMVTVKGLRKDKTLSQKIDRAVFPGLQGGPHNNQTAGILQALIEADKPAFKEYGKQVVKNAKALSDELKKLGFNLVSNGTDSHLIVIDLKNKGISGDKAAVLLEKAGIVTNKNTTPDDTSAFYPSGIRIGTPAVTTRGMKEKEMRMIANLMAEVINNPVDQKMLEKTHLSVKSLCKKFPLE